MMPKSTVGDEESIFHVKKGKLTTKKRKKSTRDAKKTAMWSVRDNQALGMRMKNQRVETLVAGVSCGKGTKHDPIQIPLRAVPNSTDCFHCPIGIDVCSCMEIEEVLSQALHKVYATTTFRRQHAYGRHPLNSKSVLPVFVTRILRLLGVQKGRDVFWDLGCGIGSVVIQAALQGIDAVGIDIQSENIEIAEETWKKVRSMWKACHPNQAVGTIQFIKGCMFKELRAIEAGTLSCAPQNLYPTKIWMSNQLFTPHMNLQLADLMTSLDSVKSVASMHDIYPHERSGITQKRNPEPYKKFTSMKDYLTQKNALEWSATEERLFYVYSAALNN